MAQAAPLTGRSSASTFFSRTRHARRLVVIEPGVLGDTVHLLPAMWTLRANYPDTELHVLCSPVGAKILELAGCADRLWTLEQAHERRTLGEQWRVLTTLRRLRFDASINFNDQDRNVIHAAFVGARQRLGQNRGNWHFWSRWCIPDWVFVTPEQRALPVFEQRRQFLAESGMALAAPRFDVSIPAAAKAWAEANVPARAIHFSISASTHLKEWPVAHWIELARRLLRDDPSAQIVATGSPQEREARRHEQLLAGVNDARLKLLSAPPAELAALFARCRLHIGNDSGALHLAFALGAPTLALFRDFPTMSEWLPRGPEHRVLKVNCGCIGQRHAECERRENAACLEKLSVETVLAAARELLAANKS